MAAIHDFLDEFKVHRDFSQVLPRLVNDERFRAELFAQIEPNTYPYAEYASWIAVHFFQKHPNFLKPWIPQFQQILHTTKNHSVQRNLVSVFIYCKTDISDNGAFLDLLFGLLESNDSLPALKVNACKVIETQYLAAHPELLHELQALVALHEDDKRPSIASMVRNFHKRYAKHTSYTHN